MDVSTRTGSFSCDIRMSSKDRKFSSGPRAPDSTGKYASDMAARSSPLKIMAPPSSSPLTTPAHKLLAKHWSQTAASRLCPHRTQSWGCDRSVYPIWEPLMVKRNRLLQCGCGKVMGLPVFCLPSCSWCSLRFSLGMTEMRGVLLVLLYMSHSSSAMCGIQKANLADEPKENFVGSNEFPWVVSLQDPEYTHLAFGCILSNFWILSTASALQHRLKVIAVVGIANMDPRKMDHTEYPVNIIIPHENFNNKSMSNNIALLRTESAIHFDDMVQAICFLGKKLRKPPTLKNCWVAGWNPTAATGNHMTMSILRRISVKDIDLCPLHRNRKTECASHISNEPTNVCLGEPGSPMMCQVKKLDLWVIRGILTYGGNLCPGLFLYTSVEDYSDWITAKARRAGPSLFALHPWEKLIPELPFQESNTALTNNSNSAQGHAEWPRSYSRGQRMSTLYDQPTDDGQNFEGNGLRELNWSSKVAIQPTYYDYYGGEVGEGGAVAGQNRLHWPQERILMSLVPPGQPWAGPQQHQAGSPSSVPLPYVGRLNPPGDRGLTSAISTFLSHILMVFSSSPFKIFSLTYVITWGARNSDSCFRSSLTTNDKGGREAKNHSKKNSKTAPVPMGTQ
ncbi:hypothetical protein A6R68_14250 [Neotoma lepida]|uniref:Inactive serine protease 54 n=1 Tax=Neotoma lepida TaxID=56216 RepID=A0A1A6H9I1_NEOLE|nr:hypothetical protein A6R68_14250 [Neotoma lepida]